MYGLFDGLSNCGVHIHTPFSMISFSSSTLVYDSVPVKIMTSYHPQVYTLFSAIYQTRTC